MLKPENTSYENNRLDCKTLTIQPSSEDQEEKVTTTLNSLTLDSEYVVLTWNHNSKYFYPNVGS